MHQLPHRLASAVGCTGCEQDACALNSELTSQCTDQCVVIACNDPDAHCDGQSDQALCNLVCDSSTNCVDCNGFDAFLQCCGDYHSYLSEAPMQSQWGPSRHPSMNVNSQQGNHWCDDCTPHPHQMPSPPLHGSFDLPHKCRWDGCRQSYASLSELIGHVNLSHLVGTNGIPQHPQEHLPIQPTQGQPEGFAGKPELQDISKLPVSCLWDDCSLFLSPENIAGPSTSSELSNMIAALECHLLQDHLGLQTHCHPHPHPHPHAAPIAHQTLGSSSLSNALCYPCHDHVGLPAASSDPSPPPHPQATTLASPATSASSLLPLTPSSSPPSEIHQDLTHQCKWQSCAMAFGSPEELTAHLTVVHVGGGKAHYECFWDDCDRHGDRGFSSKQKVCRHLQSHTGYRPFQCTLCHQNFSEAATLQQHMRRHTQEKPYACDFPGCGKSFAIMGALTIHKRIHNGLKPFKCPHCDRAFTESSNLSKHLRTHTGARPYSCMEPGCGKSFARPDQLTRHQAVHRNKTLPAPVANQE